MLLFIQSIIVYGLMIWVMIYFGNIAYKYQYPQGIDEVDKFSNRKISFGVLLTKRYFLIPIFVFCFFAAVRFQVGVDCEPYKRVFYETKTFAGLESREIESGFLLLCDIINILGGNHYLLLFVLAFLEISLLYYAQRKTTYSLKYFGLVLMLSGIYFSLMNGIRQNIAACAFVAIIPFVLEKKKWIWFLLGVFLATQMHKSAFLLFPFGVMAYFLQYKIPNKYIQLMLVVVCFILMDSVQISGITNLFSTYGAEAGYNDRDIDIYSNYNGMNKAFGFRSLLLLASYIITIWYSEKMQKQFNSLVFNIQYNLFFIGICLFLLFYNDFVINRLLYYFKIFIPIILASCMFYLWNYKSLRNKIVFRILTIILLMHLGYELYVAIQNFPLEYTLYKFDL